MTWFQNPTEWFSLKITKKKKKKWQSKLCEYVINVISHIEGLQGRLGRVLFSVGGPFSLLDGCCVATRNLQSSWQFIHMQNKWIEKSNWSHWFVECVRTLSQSGSTHFNICRSSCYIGLISSIYTKMENFMMY